MSQSGISAGLVTGIGSLPFTDVDAAVDFVATLSPEIPFWPQLPQRAAAEQMLGQVLYPFTDLLEPLPDALGYAITATNRALFIARLREAHAELDTQSAAGFWAFEHALAMGRFPEARALKGHLVGPITLGSALFVEEQSVLTDLILLPLLSAYLARIGCWQMQRLLRWGIPVLLFLDEPALPLLTTLDPEIQYRARQLLREMVTVLHAQGGLVGIHCCASLASFTTLAEATPQVISLDMTHPSIDLEAQDVSDYLAEGGFLAWGLVPTSTDLAALTPATLLAHWLLAASQIGDVSLIARRTLITATCGLGLLSPAAARQSFLLARQVAELVGRIADSKHA